MTKSDHLYVAEIQLSASHGWEEIGRYLTKQEATRAVCARAAFGRRVRKV